MQDLAGFKNDWYKPGSWFKRASWYCVSLLIFDNGLFPSSGLKRFVLRMFGATIGQNVVLKPGIQIKYPWFLTIGDHSWIGENVWIDNLAAVIIKNDVCVSQGVLLLTGNHDYSSHSFDLFIKPITLEAGVWIGAKAIVCPGVVAHKNSILQAGGVAVSDLEPDTIYAGNPAVNLKLRKFKT